MVVTADSKPAGGGSIPPGLANPEDDFTPIFGDHVWVRAFLENVEIGVNKLDCSGTEWESFSAEELAEGIIVLTDALAKAWPDLTEDEIDTLFQVS